MIPRAINAVQTHAQNIAGELILEENPAISPWERF